MTRAQDLARLGAISRMVLDLRLIELRRAAEARQRTEARIADLNLRPITDGISMIAAGQADARYQIWADVRRADLNIQLARQAAAMLQQTEEARFAFGRLQALEKVTDTVNKASRRRR